MADRGELQQARQALAGPDIALFASHYISEPGQPVLWHQDGAYWPLEPMNVVTLWLAVDHSVPENGCLRVIPGDSFGFAGSGWAGDGTRGPHLQEWS